LAELLGFLAPHLMHSSSHKVIEYLVRVYEVHAFLKHDFIMAFLPYFETAYFLKAIQLVSVKEDEFFSFLHEFAYRGEALATKILVKALARSNGVVFAKYAEWLFKYAPGDAEESSSMHHRFFGVMLIEVLLQDQSEGLLYSVLPLLSQSMKSQSSEMRQAGMFAIGQLCCKTTLSREYCAAFSRQVLLTAKGSQASQDSEMGLKVLLIILQYQSQSSLSLQDLELVSQLPRALKLLEALSTTYDLSRFLRAALSCLISAGPASPPLSKFIEKLLQSPKVMDLKCSFTTISVLLQDVVQSLKTDQEGGTNIQSIEMLRIMKKSDL
jgi:hypothetical protein